MSCIEIFKDSEWISRNIVTLHKFWKKIEYHRNNPEEINELRKKYDNTKYKKTKTEELLENNYLLDDSDSESDNDIDNEES